MIEEMRKLGEISEEKSIVLKADEQVAHGEIIRIMDLLRKNKFYKIIISTNIPD